MSFEWDVDEDEEDEPEGAAPMTAFSLIMQPSPT